VRRFMTRNAGIAVSVLVAATTAMTACSSGTSTSAGPNQVVHLTFTNWDNGMQAVVNTWNKQNPDIQVKLIKPSGTGYTLYNKLITDNSAGTNPDVSEIEYQALPEMVSSHVAISLSKYLPDLSKTYDQAALSLVQFQGQTYGVPQNICPLVFFYRKDIFSRLGLKPPTTWAQYAADAAAVHKANPKDYLGNFDAADPEWFAGLAQQAGANWWTASGDKWTVAINDAATQQVASYWENLVKKGVISPEPGFSTQWNTDMNNGTMVGWISAQWAPNQLPTIAPDTAGKWEAVAVPAWTAGDKTVGTWGGETEVVTSSSKHPAQAAKFVNWVNSSQQGLNLLIKNVDVFPAATFAQSLPALNTPPPFMSDQPGYNALMKSIAQNVRGFQIWGPDASVTFNSYSDAFASALQNHTSFAQALAKVQTATVTDMQKTGFKVTG
jgi:multiple sugar transport system substrate-binding protein